MRNLCFWKGHFVSIPSYAAFFLRAQSNKVSRNKSDKNSAKYFLHTGCSLNIVFFLKILKYSGLWSFSVFPLCQCVYTHQAGRTPALQQNWQSSEKSQSFKEKTQYLMNTLYDNLDQYTIQCLWDT